MLDEKLKILGFQLAEKAATQSTSLGRKIGASILNADGEHISSGCNSKPDKAGGYDLAKRGTSELTLEHTRLRERCLYDLANQLVNIGMLTPNEIDATIEKAMSTASFQSAQASSSLLGFSNSTHAETGAIIEAGRKAISVQGCYIFTTLFPCDMCFKHIVHAGIEKIYYKEENEWSRAREIYENYISTNSELNSGIQITKF